MNFHCIRGLLLLAALLLFPAAELRAQEAASTPMKMGSASSAGGAVGDTTEPPSAASEKRNVVTPRNGEPSAAAESAPKPNPAVESPLRGNLAEDDGDEIPPFHIAQVSVEGQVRSDRADLTVKIDVEISKDNGWHDVPLRLGQAHIYGKKATGPGQQGPAIPALQGDDLHWRFRGVGTHQLEFQVGVPVRTTPAGHQLQLSLPVMPALFEARVRLKFEKENLVVRSYNRDALIEPRSIPGEKGTLVEASIPGGRLDLLWQERNQVPEADWAATSTLTLKRASSAWELAVQQSIRRNESGRTTIVVRPPPIFTVTSIVGPQLESWTSISDRPGHVKLVFGDDAPDRIDLRWNLRAPFPIAGGIVDLHGFEIDGVRIHDGRIRVADVAGYRLLPLEDALKFLERVDDDAPPAGERPAVLCYDFSAPQWRLSLNARQLEPLFTCSPKFDLLVLEDRAQLTASYRIHQEAGEVRQLRIDVSGLERAGWVLAPAATASSSTAKIVPGGGALQLEWPSGSDSEKTGELRFERPLQGSPFDVLAVLPAVTATWPESAQLTIRAADSIRLEANADDAPLSAALEATGSAPSPRTIVQTSLKSGASQLRLRGSKEPRAITASAIISVQDVQPQRLIVEQAIRFRVDYGRLDAVRFQLPEGFPVNPGSERFAFRIRVDGREAEDVEWTNGSLRVRLPQPMLGRFTVVLGYGLPRKEGESTLTLPIVPVLDAAFSDVAIEMIPSLGVSVVSDSKSWRIVPSSAERLSWTSIGAAKSALLAIASTVRTSQQRIVVKGAYLRTRLDGRGVQHTTARYLIPAGATSLVFSLPRRPTNLDVEIAGRVVDEIQPVGSADRAQWQVRLPRGGDASTDVKITYNLPPAGEMRSIAKLSVELPELANVYLEKLVWALELPESDVVMMSPTGFSRLFEWRREGVIWQRRPTPGFLDSLREIGFESAAAGDAGTAEIRYVYSQFGPATRIELWTIDRSLVVLVGAGVTLIVGFFFWTLPRTRNAATFLLLAFAVCLAGLWVSEPIQVLLQPAAFGAIMATVATAIDSRARRRDHRNGGESSVRLLPRPASAARAEPIRTTILRPAGSDHGVPG